MKTYRVTIWFYPEFHEDKMERHFVQAEAENVYDFLRDINEQWCLKPGDKIEFGPVSVK